LLLKLGGFTKRAPKRVRESCSGLNLRQPRGKLIYDFQTFLYAVAHHRNTRANMLNIEYPGRYCNLRIKPNLVRNY